MAATVSEALADRDLTQPLAPTLLSPAVAALLAGSAPQKMMAARGIAPLRPADLAIALYQLSFETDEGTRQAANGAPANLPDGTVTAIMKEALPAPVLHFFGLHLPAQRTQAIEALLYNAQTPDTTFVSLARRLPVNLLDIICENEARLLRCPAIVKVLFENAATRMSSINRALELCARNNVEVDIPAYQEMVDAIRQDAEATNGARDDFFFDTIADQDRVTEADIAALLTKEGEAPDVAAPADPAAGDAKRPEQRQAIIIDFSRLKIFEKIRLATVGNQYCRTNLVRDANRLVAMSAIRSPKVTDAEIINSAGSKAVHIDVVRYISNSREYLKMYAVRRALVTNPKCPLQQAIRLISTLQLADIKKIATSKNVATSLSTTARRIVEQKEKT